MFHWLNRSIYNRLSLALINWVLFYLLRLFRRLDFLARFLLSFLFELKVCSHSFDQWQDTSGVDFGADVGVRVVQSDEKGQLDLEVHWNIAQIDGVQYLLHNPVEGETHPVLHPYLLLFFALHLFLPIRLTVHNRALFLLLLLLLLCFFIEANVRQAPECWHAQSHNGEEHILACGENGKKES